MTRSENDHLTPAAPPTARGRAVLSETDRTARCRVDLVWEDPETGVELALDFEASPGLVASLRAAGFDVQEGPAEGSSEGPTAGQAA